ADKLMITTSFYHKEAVVIKTGSTYSVLWRYAYGTTGRIFFDKISSDLASITETQLLETTGSVPIGWISATWNETHSEIAVVYCLGAANDNQIYFMRIDSNGTTVEEALQITSDTASRHGSQVFWTEDDDYTLVYSEETGSAGDILYVCTIDSSAAVSIPSSTTRISPTSHDIRNRAPAYWTGSELGVIWLDSNNGNTIYFNRYNKDGSSISGGPFDILSDFTGTGDDYISS
ncbi:MAG: hypothetical protein U9N32_06390, partial [Spirochaetota bacterium]|nr:hypothetical protein [Spirochaetota bacterium]